MTPPEPSRPAIAAALADRYTIERELGRGGMATVYLADEKKHGRKVAIKVLRPEITAALGTKRFLREIGIAAQLSHPHIVPLIDSGEAAGMLYYVQPHVPGGSLRERLLEHEGRRELQGDLAWSMVLRADVLAELGEGVRARTEARKAVALLKAEIPRTGRADLHDVLNWATSALKDVL